MKDYDLFGVLYQGGCGYGDPLERDSALIEKDLANGLLTEAVARKVYGYAKTAEKTAALRDRMRKKRLQQSVPAQRWWRRERARAKSGKVTPVVAQTFARSVKLSDKLKKLYLDFWKLDEFPYTDTGSADFTTQAPTGFYYPKSSARKKDAKATA